MNNKPANPGAVDRRKIRLPLTQALVEDKGMMETQKIDFIDTECSDQLLRLLREKVFHVTTTKAYRKMLKDGFVIGNQDEKYPINAGSLKSFGRHRGWICLFDLRGKSDKQIDDALMAYYFLAPSWFKEYFRGYTESRLVYLIVSAICHDQLVPNQEGRKSWNDGSGYVQYIPDVECWFPEQMSIGLIEKVICVRIRNCVRKDDPLLYAHHKLALKEKRAKSTNKGNSLDRYRAR